MLRPPPPPPPAAAAASSSPLATATVEGDHVPLAQDVVPARSFVQSLMDQNPYFSAGAGLMGITALLAFSRKLVGYSAVVAQRRLLVSLEIPSKDHAYPWFLEWMAHHSAKPHAAPALEGPFAGVGSGSSRSSSSSSSTSLPAPSAAAAPTSLLSRLASRLAFRPPRSHELAVETSYKKHDNGSSEALFSLVPGPGTHWFRYREAWMQVKRDRSQKQMDLHSGSPWETLTLTTLSRDRHLFPLLLAEARALAQRAEVGKTVVYTAWGVEWRPFGKPRRVREMKSVVLDRQVGEEIRVDLTTFMGRAKWYAERGIPYRRGYLLHGPPGSGKSSYIQALAGSLRYNICLLNLSERGLTDDKLSHLLSLVPERSIVLLEDVDAAFSRRRQQTTEDGYQSAVTFSGLLNTLDGVASAEERIIFMTTNHLDRLDPALVRPGRVDLVAYLGDASPYQARELFTRFYGNAGGETDAEAEAEGQQQQQQQRWLAERAEAVERYVRFELEQQGRAISMAALQGLFIRSPAEAVQAELPALFADRGTVAVGRSASAAPKGPMPMEEPKGD